jgi:hypothetical protein
MSILLRIRVSWINAPELGQAFGRRAKQIMSALVFGKDVELHQHAIDRYGRTVAMVFVDGRDVGLELISFSPSLSKNWQRGDRVLNNPHTPPVTRSGHRTTDRI